MNRAYTFRVISILLLLISAGVAGYALFNSACKQQEVAIVEKQGSIAVVPYVPERDRTDILNMFQTDTYWLLWDPNSPVADMIDTRSPNMYQTKYFGKMGIAVARDGNSFAGFTTYWMHNFYRGQILFVSVHPDHRRKGVAQKLIAYAFEELKKQGAQEVMILTRVTNTRARALYENKIGFEKTAETDTHIYYRKKLA